MKYVCKKDCYVRNPQGKLQHFKAGMSVDYADGVDVAEHFEMAGGSKPKLSEKEEIMRKLDKMKINYSASASLVSLRKKLKDSEMK